MRKVGVLALAVAAALVAQEPVTVAYSSRPLLPHDIVPSLYQAFLIYDDGPNRLTVYNTHTGELVYTASVKNPPISGNARLTSIALTREGTAAVGIANLPGDDGYTGGVAFLDRSGVQIRFSSTGHFLPCHLTYDAKGSLWAFGVDVASDSQDYALVRRFDEKGNQTGAFLMRSSFPSAPFHCNRGLWTARASKDRVGAMAQFWNMAEPRESRGTLQQWVELDLDGKEIGRWTLGAEREGPAGGMAFTDDSGLFVEWRGEMRQLNRNDGVWRPARVQRRGLLLGAEGNQLVYAEGNGSRFVWIRP
jgi:hypothetical protein